ncbi:alpha/beta hydrolase [Robertkochia solimangrovi]|uniref:alpha/beta hydrolase n=1 Tax=Robertkochia solimangrovi TaxID=2213046 RepID=UPI00118106CF|nr:alpha/beta hydrolase [Robertkochia solimangrovi]TRZ45994.1 alpha/beta hydrolase [Robertkochia solimangrovi]
MKKLLSLLFICGMFFTYAQTDTTHEIKIKKDIQWSSPEGYDLTMDIYTPDSGMSSYPVLIIYHGGGWLINNKSIMDQMSSYVASHGNYVVCNVDYRLLTANDNTTNMNSIVEDALGAVIWVKEHISSYQGDPNRIAVTGDSAGGHLAAMVVNGNELLGSHGFDGNHFEFTPSYIPSGATPEELRTEGAAIVQAAILSYPAVDIYAANKGNGKPYTGFESASNFFWQMGGGKPRGIFGNDVNAIDNPGYYKQVSPMYTIPDSNQRKLPPQFLHVGSKDNTTTPESIKAYHEALLKAGHPSEFWIYEDRPHAYLDSGSNEYLGVSFEKDAITPLNRILDFLNDVFYKD